MNTIDKIYAKWQAQGSKVVKATGTSEGASLGWEHRPHHAEFGSPEKARELHMMLSDMKKYGNARQPHLEKLDRAEKYLGIGAHKEKTPISLDEEETISRTQGAIDAFHRTMIVPHLQEKPKNALEKARHASKLWELKSHHETAKEISQDKSISYKEREERVKGLLMHGRSIYS